MNEEDGVLLSEELNKGFTNTVNGLTKILLGTAGIYYGLTHIPEIIQGATDFYTLNKDVIKSAIEWKPVPELTGRFLYQTMPAVTYVLIGTLGISACISGIFNLKNGSKSIEKHYTNRETPL